MKTYQQLSQEERYLITALRRCGHSINSVARALGRSPSTISRELRRNTTTHDGQYRAEKAHKYAVARRRRCRRKSHFSSAQWSRVFSLVREKWSPEQISGYLKVQREMSISAETIYRYLRRDKQARGPLWNHTRGMSKFGRKRYRSKDSRGVLAGKRSIHERPPSVQSRRTLGHWEIDTVIGKDGRHCVLTMVERKSGFGIIKKLSARSVAEVTRAAASAIIEHRHRIKTVTCDNGTEFHGYKELEQRFDVKCYFATPYHSWERGSNENFNGLLRQYLPKGSCFRSLTQRRCDEIAQALNSRPRKRHGFKSPNQIYYRGVALAR